MSRTETASNPLVENNSSAAHRIASRMFGLRGATSSPSGERIILYKCTNGPVESTNIWASRRERRAAPALLRFQELRDREPGREHLAVGKSNPNRRLKLPGRHQQKSRFS